MKLFLTILFCSLFFGASAQIDALDYYIGFDHADYKWRFDDGYKPDTNVIKWIMIDTVHYHHNVWQIGKPNKIKFDSSYSALNVIVTDTIHSCSANDTSVFILKVPKHAWLGLLYLTFKYKLDLDTGDIAMIELSSDTGLHWMDIAKDTTHSFNFWPDTALRLTKSNGNWDSAHIRISSGLIYAGPDTFLFRFSFITGDSTRLRDGWMIDNFLMPYDGEAVHKVGNDKYFNIYPNPVNDQLAIHYTLPVTEDISIQLSNVLGETILSKEIRHAFLGNAYLPVADIPEGVYYCTIRGGDEKITRPVVIRH
jgi:hypothetical protein